MAFFELESLQLELSVRIWVHSCLSCPQHVALNTFGDGEPCQKSVDRFSKGLFGSVFSESTPGYIKYVNIY